MTAGLFDIGLFDEAQFDVVEITVEGSDIFEYDTDLTVTNTSLFKYDTDLTVVGSVPSGSEVYDTDLSIVGSSLFKYDTQLFIRFKSQIIAYEPPKTITTANLSYTSVPSDALYEFLMSANNGSDYESITPGIEHTFINLGSELVYDIRGVSSSGAKITKVFVEYTFNE